LKIISLSIFKFTVSAGLLFLLFVSTDFGDLKSLLFQVDLRYFSIALSAMILGVIVSAYKWQALLAVNGIDCGLWTLVRYYLIGIFFNNFLPTSIGGDAMRACLLTARYGRGSSAISSVLAERFSGFLALLLVAGALSYERNFFSMQRWLGVCFLLAVSALLVFAKGIWWKSLLTPLPDRLRTKTLDFFTALLEYRNDRRAMCIMSWTSLIFPFLVGIVYYCAGLAFSVYIPLLDFVVISALVTLLTLIPISLHGLGLRDGGFVYFLGLLDISQAQALSVTLLVFGLTLLLSLTGGILLLFERSKKERLP